MHRTSCLKYLSEQFDAYQQFTYSCFFLKLFNPLCQTVQLLLKGCVCVCLFENHSYRGRGKQRHLPSMGSPNDHKAGAGPGGRQEPGASPLSSKKIQRASTHSSHPLLLAQAPQQGARLEAEHLGLNTHVVKHYSSTCSQFNHFIQFEYSCFLIIQLFCAHL